MAVEVVVDPREVLPALTAAIDDVLAAQWWRCGDEELRAAVVELERQANRLEAGRLRLLAEAHARDVGAPSGAARTADWFAHATGTRPERAAARVALAEAVSTELAPTGAALAAGEITVDHAGVVHRTLDRLHPGPDAATRSEAQEFLLEHATVLDPRRLARLGHRLRHRLDPAAGEALAAEEDTQHRNRALTVTQDDDGTWWLSGTLDKVAGQCVHDALTPHAAPLPAADDGTPDRRTGRQRLADALVHLCQQALAGHPHGSSSGAAVDAGSTEGHGTDPAAAPTGIRPTAGAGSGCGGSLPSRPRLIVSTTLPAITAAPGQPGIDGGTLSGGQPVSAATIQVLACDAEIVPVLIDGAGQPLDVGRTVYAFPARIRTAITERDRGCTFPSCTRPAPWCDLHHLQSFATGGPTSERNGTLLCGYHHRLVHQQGWRGHLDGTHVTWHPPDGNNPHVPPPPWAPALDRLTSRWLNRNPHLRPTGPSG